MVIQRVLVTLRGNYFGFNLGVIAIKRFLQVNDLLVVVGLDFACIGVFQE